MAITKITSSVIGSEFTSSLRYDSTNDAFIPPKPFGRWVLNATSFLREAPTPHPSDGKIYTWNEEPQQWDLITE
jgi:hypothetical protein